LPEAEDNLPVMSEQETDPAHDGAGHRARLRARLLGGGAEALADYEVLEYLLFAAIKQGDTKPIAKALIKRFGNLAGVLNADAKALQSVKRIGETSAEALKSVALAARRMARVEVQQKPGQLAGFARLPDHRYGASHRRARSGPVSQYPEPACAGRTCR
jgi:DNA repair protein RadC